MTLTEHVAVPAPRLESHVAAYEHDIDRILVSEEEMLKAARLLAAY